MRGRTPLDWRQPTRFSTIWTAFAGPPRSSIADCRAPELALWLAIDHRPGCRSPIGGLNGHFSDVSSRWGPALSERLTSAAFRLPEIDAHHAPSAEMHRLRSGLASLNALVRTFTGTQACRPAAGVLRTRLGLNPPRSQRGEARREYGNQRRPVVIARVFAGTLIWTVLSAAPGPLGAADPSTGPIGPRSGCTNDRDISVVTTAGTRLAQFGKRLAPERKRPLGLGE